MQLRYTWILAAPHNHFIDAKGKLYLIKEKAKILRNDISILQKPLLNRSPIDLDKPKKNHRWKELAY